MPRTSDASPYFVSPPRRPHMGSPPRRLCNEEDEDAYADEQAQQVADVLKRAAEVAVPQSPRREATGLAQEDAEGGTASASSNIDIDVASQADNADPANKRRRLRSKPHVTDDSSSGPPAALPPASEMDACAAETCIAPEPRAGESLFIVNQPFLERLLAGVKLEEIRPHPWSGRRLIGYGGIVHGIAFFGDPVHIHTAAEFRRRLPRHTWEIQALPYKQTWALQVLAIRRLAQPVPYNTLIVCGPVARFQPRSVAQPARAVALKRPSLLVTGALLSSGRQTGF